MPLLNDFLWNICKSCRIEAIALWAGSFDELVQECNCFLAWIFTLIFNHACLGRANHKSDFAIFTCSLRNAWDIMPCSQNTHFSGQKSTEKQEQCQQENPILPHVPCGPGARPRCGNSPPPGSGSEWRTASGSGSSPPAPSPPRSLWLFRQTWPCLCLGTQGDSSGTLGNTGGTVESIHSSHGATETDTRQTNAAIDLCVCFFSSPLCARQTEWRVRAISGKWPENWPHNNHPPLHCRKNMLLLSWGLLQVILQRKSRKPQLEIG